MGRAKEKAAEAERRARRAASDFKALLRDAEGLYADTPWEQFEETFSSEPEFQAVSDYVSYYRGRQRTLLQDMLGALYGRPKQAKTGQNRPALPVC